MKATSRDCTHASGSCDGRAAVFLHDEATGSHASQLVSIVVLGRVLDDSYAPEVRRDLTAFAAAPHDIQCVLSFRGPVIATIARVLHSGCRHRSLRSRSRSSSVGLAVDRRLVDRLGDAGGRRGLGAAIIGTCLAAATQGVALLAIALVILGQATPPLYLGYRHLDRHACAVRTAGRVTGRSRCRGVGLLIGVSTRMVTARLELGRLPQRCRSGWPSWRSWWWVASTHRPTNIRTAAKARPLGKLVIARLADPAVRFHITRRHALIVTFGSWLETIRFDVRRCRRSRFLLGAGGAGRHLVGRPLHGHWASAARVAVGLQ